MLQFGKITGIDIPNENNGLVPTVKYFNKAFGVNGWTKGHLANLAIGQGELLTTPLQIAQFAMILANNGVYHKPHLVDHIYQYNTRKDVRFPTETQYIRGISNDVYQFVREGMKDVVHGGTGWLAKVKGIDMAGKTGSAQNPHGDTHAWFMAFAPYDNPEIAISVIIENGGGGGAVAAPIARKFLEMYFYGKVLPRPVVTVDSSSIDQSGLLGVPDPDALQPLAIPIWGDSL
jgi:penicillin-binding protein 2